MVRCSLVKDIPAPHRGVKILRQGLPLGLAGPNDYCMGPSSLRYTGQRTKISSTAVYEIGQL